MSVGARHRPDVLWQKQSLPGTSTHRTSYYVYDYQIKPLVKSSDERMDHVEFQPYDPTDYRGNTVRILATDGFTVLEYQNDNEKLDAIGLLVKQTDNAIIDSDGQLPLGSPDQLIVTTIDWNDRRQQNSRKIARKYEKSAKEFWDYNDAGLVVSYTDPNNLTRKTISFKEELPERVAIGSNLYVYQYDDRGYPKKIERFSDDGSILISTQTLVYDQRGFLRDDQLVDKRGEILSFSQVDYTPAGNPFEVADTLGTRTLTLYNGNGLVQKTSTNSKGPLGTTATPLVYPNHFLGGAPTAIQKILSFEYYSDGRKKLVRDDVNGGEILSRYFVQPGASLLTASDSLYRGTKTWVVTPRVAGVTDSAGLPQLNQFDVSVTESDALGRVHLTDNLLRGGLTKYEYADPRLDQPTTITQRQSSQGTGASLVTVRRYDNRGNTLYEKSGERAARETQYDELSFPKASSVLTAFGGVIEFTTNPVGLVRRSKETRRNEAGTAKEITTTRRFDEERRLVTDKAPLDGIENGTNPERVQYTFESDTGWQVITNTDRLGNITISKSDALGRVRESINAMGGVARYEYDHLGNKTKETIDVDSDGALPIVNISLYDAFGRLRFTDNSGRTSYVDYFDKKSTTVAQWTVVTTDQAGLQSGQRMDSLGNVILAVGTPGVELVNAQGSIVPDNSSHVQAFSYQWDYSNDALTTTTTNSVGRSVSPSAAPTVNLAYADIVRYRDKTSVSGSLVQSDRAGGPNGTYTTKQRVISDSTGRPAQATIDGAFTGYTYDDAKDSAGTGEVKTLARALTDILTYFYDSIGRSTKVKNSTKDLIRRDLDQRGRLDTEKLSEARNAGAYDFEDPTYRARTRLVSEADTGTSFATVDATKGTIISTGTIKDVSYVKTTKMDYVGRVKNQSISNGAFLTYKYDPFGNILSITDAEGLVTSWTYDAYNRPITETDPNGATTYKTYDRAGNLIAILDPNGNLTQYNYDSNNRLICVTDPEGRKTTSTYDPFGNRRTLTDPNNNTTTWTYDQYDRIKTETNTLGQKKTFEYNAIGQVIKLIKADDGVVGNGDDRVIEYVYDPIQHTTTENWISGSTQTKSLFYQYDAYGHLLEANDGSVTVRFDYEDGKLKSESNTLAPGVAVEYVYNYLDADLASITTLVGATFQSKTLDSQIEYSYTPNGQIETIAQSGPNETSKAVKYSYDLAGRITQIERSEPPPPSGNPPTVPAFASFLTTTFSYRDAQGKKTTRIQSMSHTAPNSTLASSTLLASYSLGWDPGGRLVSMTSTADDAATFTYDRTDQLKSATYDKPAYADLTFSYDANGNRNGGGNTPGPDNRQASDGVSDFAYDLDGNMTRRTNKTTGAVVEYAWDLRNRLTDVTFKSSATGPITKTVHYTYDALNRRIGKSVDTDGNGTLDQVEWFANRGLRTDRENAGDEVMLRMNASGNVTSRYLHGASVDEILAEENIAANGTRDVLWPLADQQGSVRDIARRGADGRATIVNHVMYGPFGEKVAETDTAIAHLYGYTGREYDQETGLQYNRARYYDPKLGRFISQDPIGFAAGDANLYRYVGNKPTMATDPSGLDELDPVTGERIRTPAASRGKWISGTPGNGVFEFLDTPQNRSAGVAGSQVRYQGNYIAVGGFPESWYFGGSSANATVSIPKVLGTDVDFDEADKAMRESLKDPNWKRPAGYTWNHAGDPTSTKMELIESRPGYKHGAVAHKGSASNARAALRTSSGALGVLTVYMALRDISEFSGDKYTEVDSHLAAFYDSVDDSVFIVREGNWVYSPRAVYVGGARDGEERILTNAEFNSYKKMYHDAYGEYIPGMFGLSPKFRPGTERKTLPAIKFGFGGEIYAGFIDMDGVHWDDRPCNVDFHGRINM